MKKDARITERSRHSPRKWLPGFLYAEIRKTDDSRLLSLNPFLPFQNASIRVRMLDRSLREIDDDTGCPVTLLEQESPLNGPMRIPFNRQNLRALQLFGRMNQFFCGTTTVEVREEYWKQCCYFEFQIKQGGSSDAVTASHDRPSNDSACIILLMSRKKLAAFGPPKLFLLISKGEARRRMEQLRRKCPELRRKHDKTRLGLSSLMIKMFFGGDTLLLTEQL